MAGCCNLPSNWKDVVEHPTVCPKCGLEGVRIDARKLKEILSGDNWNLVFKPEEYCRCLNKTCSVSLFSRVDNMWFWNQDLLEHARWKEGSAQNE
ncbi:hypothetical protein [Effusibacillus pohliae]|uniref:hypothetical protein n=1 Tax=Effusibacillus pohliae TaxID=232270 RepID=UPI0003797C50